MSSRSPAWNFFDRITASSARCRQCGTLLNTSGGSTSGLLRHLRIRHDKNCESSCKLDDTPPSCESASGSKRPGASEPEPQRKKQATLGFKVRPHRSLEESLARLAAVDGISINAICRSDFISHAFERQGLRLPKNPSDIMTLIVKFSNEKQSELRQKLQQMKEQEQRFSLTIDEWTSTANKRYLNVNLHGNGDYVACLGLVRITGTFTAENMLEAVTDLLAVFNIDMQEDCVSVITDGAAVMKKFGRLTSCEIQLCFAHALHLSVCDWLYKVPESTSDDDDHIPFDEEAVEEESGSESFDSDDNDNFTKAADAYLPLAGKVGHIVEKVRKDVIRFRRSSKDDEKLQSYVRDEHGQELKPVLDIKTRWNSLHAMLARYVQLRSSLKKALIDLHAASNVSDKEFEVVRQLVDILEHIQVASDALCRKNATLLTSESVIKFLTNTLSELEGPLSNNLLAAIKARCSERRNVMTTSLLSYLHNPDYNLEVSKKSVQNFAVNLLTRLKGSRQTEAATSPDADEDLVIVDAVQNASVNETRKLSLAEQLQKCISADISDHLTEVVEIKSLYQEFKLFEQQRQRTPNLEFIYNALLTIKPSSVEAERVFSTSGNFATKIRSRIKDKALKGQSFKDKALKAGYLF